jgi:hypothetical protein
MPLAVLVGWSGRSASQVPARVAFDSAAYAWEAGQYPEALERMARLLTGPHRDTLLAPIALLTGELYRTSQLAPDGANPRWSTDGRTLAYEIGVDPDRRSVLLELGDTPAGLPPDTLQGYAATFAPDGSEIAYLHRGGSAVVLRSLSGGAARAAAGAA